jgi:uncharacterized protein (TIGR02757 family)
MSSKGLGGGEVLGGSEIGGGSEGCGVCEGRGISEIGGGREGCGVSELREILERLHDRYNTASFVADDPISIPHRFGAQNDIEIAGFLASTIAWGNRKAIVRSAGRMIDLMDGQPGDFVMNASEKDLNTVSNFVHRTFNGDDLRSFVLSLRHIYSEFGSMGGYFEGEFARSGDLREVMARFRREFFKPQHSVRCEKHFGSIERGAACKRINMFLRWMVRSDDRGVDFGLWRAIPPSALYLPLDIHSAATARSLGLLTRRQNDWRAVEEVTARLREFDLTDPAKYDFALFGAGIDGWTAGRFDGVGSLDDRARLEDLTAGRAGGWKIGRAD